MKFPKPRLVVIGVVAFVALIIIIIINPFVIVKTGHRGVVLRFSEVTGRVLDEGLHVVIPVVYDVKQLTVQTQKMEDDTLAYSKGTFDGMAF